MTTTGQKLYKKWHQQLEEELAKQESWKLLLILCMTLPLCTVPCNNKYNLCVGDDLESLNFLAEKLTHQSSSHSVHDTSSQVCTVPCNNKYNLCVGDDLESLNFLAEKLTHQSSSHSVHDTSSQKCTVPCNNKYNLCGGR